MGALVMLRPKRFRPFETIILWCIGVLLLGVGSIGVLLALQRADWRLAVVSVGILALTTIYLCAAKRGKPL